MKDYFILKESIILFYLQKCEAKVWRDMYIDKSIKSSYNHTWIALI